MASRPECPRRRRTRRLFCKRGPRLRLRCTHIPVSRIYFPRSHRSVCMLRRTINALQIFRRRHTAQSSILSFLDPSSTGFSCSNCVPSSAFWSLTVQAFPSVVCLLHHHPYGPTIASCTMQSIIFIPFQPTSVLLTSHLYTRFHGSFVVCDWFPYRRVPFSI